VATAFVAPYLWLGELLGPARYVAADASILAVAAWCWGRAAPRRVGVRIPWADLARAAMLLIVGLWVTGWLLDSIATASGVRVDQHRPAFSLSQVFHQELVLRALLLGALVDRVRPPIVLAAAAAVLFAGIHPLLFWWQAGLVLPLTTSLSLFCFGLASNWVFLRSGHIAYSFALHAAWNLQRFGGLYVDANTGRPISEARSFALIEGSGLAVLAGALLVAGVFAAEFAARWRAR